MSIRPLRLTQLPRLSLLSLGLLTAVHAYAQDSDTDSTSSDAKTLDQVLVVAQRANRISNGATNLPLDIKDTPQSISLVSREQMDDFGADNLNDALRLATGIQVEEWETNRTNYLSRGFEIENTQIDGVGMPNDWGIVTGAMDSFGYDKIEVIRGANGLLTGVGNAAGTINYVRKRPTNDEQGSVGVSYGSWGTKRVQADYSTPITKDGTWAVRVVAAHEDGGSYLRDFDNKRNFLYGVIDGQIGDKGTLTAGYSYQKAKSTGNMWGALTYNLIDGSQTSWSRSASTTQDWTYWNTTNETGFLEYTYELSSNWQLKASYNYRHTGNDDELFFAYTYAGLDPDTGEGLYGWPYKGQDKQTAHLGVISLEGTYELFGREQQAMAGVSESQSEQVNWYFPGDSSAAAYGLLPGFPYAGNAVAEPTWSARALSSTLNQRIKRAYATTRVSLTQRLKTVLGVNYTEYHRDGDSDGDGYGDFDQTENNTGPYAGLTWDFSDDILGYVSYSDIYQPQEQVDITNHYLDPSKGVNYEVGVKANWLDKRLLTTLAWFDAKQEGLATYAGYSSIDGVYYYEPKDVESKGVEFEATGKLGDYVDLVLGYTHLQMTGPDGDDTYLWVPRNTANLALSARLPSYTALSAGISGRWQSETSNVDSYSGYTVRQGNYTVLNAFIGWDFLPNASLRLNVNNLTDEKYISSLYQIGYYGAPRNYSISLDYRF